MSKGYGAGEWVCQDWCYENDQLPPRLRPRNVGKRKGYGGCGCNTGHMYTQNRGYGSTNGKTDTAENAMLMVLGTGFLIYIGFSTLKFFSDLDAERRAEV